VKDFVTAVVAEDEADDGAISFKHNGTEVTFFKPSEGQEIMLLAMGGRGMNQSAVANFIHLFFELMDEDTQLYFRDLLMDRKSGFGVYSEGGIFDIWEGLMEEWSGKDSEKPSDLPPSRRTTGRKSTATTPVKASTSSRSRSRAS
jgi:hypothetical protein